MQILLCSSRARYLAQSRPLCASQTSFGGLRRPEGTRLQPNLVIADMELNTKGRYAVMALADLAQHSVKAPGEQQVASAVPLSTVAERQQLSLAYLEQIFLLLRRAGLVESARGRSGGYRLTRDASDISVAEIMVAAEEETRMTRCGEKTGACLGNVKCVTHGLWHALGQHIDSFLSEVTLADVVGGAFSANKRIADKLNEITHEVMVSKEAHKS